MNKRLLLIALALIASPVGHSQAASKPAAAGAAPSTAATSATAVFAGGCFWCVESAFDSVPGVSQVVSGYSGGSLPNPTYERVGAGGTGHAEVVEVTYDPRRIGYATLLEIFWRNIDPFDAGGQFCDRGDTYRAEIFVANAEERALAESSKAAVVKRFGKPVATRITAASRFYPAEEYHQDYHLRNPLRYKFYRSGCGRDARLDTVWGPDARGTSLLPSTRK